MQCRFTLNEPGVGPDGGGTVPCQISGGANFDADFCSGASKPSPHGRSSPREGRAERDLLE